MRSTRIATLILTVSGGLVGAPAALSQTGELVLEEILVTAQRREQSLQEVPISVSAFSAATIEDRNIRSAIDYLALTPNVSFTEDGQTGSRGLGIAIRGINNLITGENAFVNSVGIYLDEFSVASVPNQVANPNLSDMERVEVLRGPQGTFFGRNALGGALNLTTRKPGADFEAEIGLGAETYEDAGDQYSVTGMVNLPVSDSLSLRAVGYYEDSDGFVENACRSGASASSCPAAAENGFTPNGQDDSGHETVVTRLHANWAISDRTNALLSVYYSDDDQDADENVPSGVLDLDTIDSFGLSAAIDPGTGFWPRNQDTMSHDLRETIENEATVGVLNISHQLTDDIRIVSITGIIDAELDRVFDNDLVGGADTVIRTNAYDGTSWSTELRLELTRPGYDFIAGVLYADDEQKQENNVAISTQPTATIGGIGWLPPFPEGLGLLLNDKKWEVESIAVFADYTWHFNEKLDLIVGARYTDDTVKNRLAAQGIAPSCCFEDGPADPNFFPSYINIPRPVSRGKEDFDDLSPRFVARYQVNEDINIYGTVSKGYKAGGLALGNNTNAPGQPAFALPFDEESLWNYELGFKSELWERRVRLNGSLFYLEWEDLQLESFRFLTPGDLSSNFEQTINVDDAEAWGGELELVALLTERITINSAVGYIDTEITSDSSAEITGGFVVDLQDLEIPKSPELTFNISGEYRFPIGEHEAWVLLEFIHRDGQFSDVESLTYKQTDGPSPNSGLARNSIATFGDYPFKTPDYDIWNLRAGYDMANWRFIAYVENLDEEEYYTGTQENFGASGFRLRPHPRTIGGSISYRF